MALTGNSQPKPNNYWLSKRGMWLGYCASVALLHFLLLSVPFFSTPTAWTLTHVIHNIGMYLLFHYLKGNPFPSTGDQGDGRRLTHWELIDDGEQYTATRKFLIAVPISLFIMASIYTASSSLLTVVNILALLVGVVPKLPQLHKFRLFGINKY